MLKGIYPTLTTPFRRNEISSKMLIENLNKYNKKKLSGYVILGSNGENVFLTREEKLKLISTIREHTGKNKTLIAATGFESIKETVSMTNKAAKLGVDYALIITPSFFKSSITRKVLITYYTAVADKVTIPVIIYNVPKFTNVNIDAETVAELAAHPNIAGIKNSTENIAQLSEIIIHTPDKFATLVGTGSVLLDGLSAGAVGGIIALANVAPDNCIKIYDLFKSGKIKAARKIQQRMLSVNKAITFRYGIAGLKTAMGILGYYGGTPRKPLQPLTANNVKNIQNILIKAELLS
ncbi:4-hydroxy-tetrahydrodipicolinate synthase [bacterium BMS3Abin03]|nr:4-hydroxy-tetrahydrodipicolinate synthase [bacterium BMS3Abin03]